jgi:hypothetical protein
MRRAIASLLLITAVLASAGCTTRLVDFTMISTKNVDWSRADEFKRTGGRVVGEDIARMIVVIPTGMPNMKEAIDRAIESVPGGVALVDGVVSSKFWTILIYAEQSFVVEGTPLVDPRLAGGQ